MFMLSNNLQILCSGVSILQTNTSVFINLRVLSVFKGYQRSRGD